MSSTQMDLSPIVIERKQDITSWPEGDTTRLTAREKNRYQKRKSAIEDYFKTDLSVEEISLRYRLSSKDPLETMAGRCLMRHEDTQIWGFRALLPEAKVIDHSTAVENKVDETSESKTQKESLIQASLLPEESTPEIEEELDDENTTKLPAIKLAATVSSSSSTSDPVAQVDVEALPSPEISPTVTLVPLVTELEETSNEDDPVASISLDDETEPTVTLVPLVTELEETSNEDDPVASISLDDETEPTGTLAPLVTELEETSNENDLVASISLDDETEPTGTLVPPVTELEETNNEDDPVASISLDDGTEPTGTLAPLITTELEEKGEDKASLGTSLENEAEVAEEQETLDNQQATELEDALTASATGLEVSSTQVSEREEAERTEIAALDTIETAKVATKKATHVVLAEAEIAPLTAISTSADQLQQSEMDRLAAAETIETKAVTSGEQKMEAELPAVVALTPVLQPEETTQETSLATDIGSEQETTLPATDESGIAKEQALTQLPGGTALQAPEANLDTRPTLALRAMLRRNSRQLAMARPLAPPTHSLVEESRYSVTGSQTAIRHSVIRRWVRLDKKQKHRRWTKIVSAAVIVTLLVILLIPLAAGVVGYNAYTNIKGVANDGLTNLMSIKDLLPTNKNDITSALNTQKLKNASASLSKAQDDFLQLQDMVNRPDIQSLLQEFAPQYSDELGQARHLVQVALDVSSMGQELIGVAEMGAGIIHGSPLSSGSSTPLLTADDINAVEAALVHAQYYIGDIQTQMSQVNLAQLPLGTAAQKAQFTKYLQLLPQVQSTIIQVQSLIGPVSWLLGIGQPRHFLVQTLDRGELRSSGGFEGQYGVLTLQNGRMSPFTLTDITALDYDENGAELGAHPPAGYSWMDFGNFGVRDANVSANYPTTAQIVMNTFEAEGGGPIDGDIQITPVVIEQFLQLTGSIYLSDYKQTVTAQNFEQIVHSYQQNPELINLQKQVTGTNTHSTRKSFTSLIGQQLMARIKTMSVSQLISFGKILLLDLKSRDLQVYFTNPVAEQWLTQNNDSGAMPSFTNGTDGFMVAQSNISISKASQFVQSTFNDHVQLDGQGGATHTLTIKLDYNRGNNPVYGFNTYADYLRVYAPPNAQLLSAYGFDTGATLCTPTGKAASTTKTGSGGGKTGGTGNTGGFNYDENVYNAPIGYYPVYGCSQYDHFYPDSDSRYCSNGNYELGYNGMFDKPWAVQNLGGPSTSTSDLPGYKMWGGLTLTPTNCTSTITLTWYVPNVVQKTAGQSPYQMIVGHQSGWPDIAQVSIDASALKGVKSLTYNQTINDDTLIALANLPAPSKPKPSNSQTPAVTPTPKPQKP